MSHSGGLTGLSKLGGAFMSSLRLVYDDLLSKLSQALVAAQAKDWTATVQRCRCQLLEVCVLKLGNTDLT